MSDRLINTLAGVSLALCVVMLVVWGFFYLIILAGGGESGMHSLDWLFLAVTGIVPGIWFTKVWLAKAKIRRQFGRRICANCGYDLRATPDRCPECGTIRANST